MSPDALVILSSVTTPIQVIDRNFRFVFVNPAYLRVFGKTWEELAGQNVFDIYPEDPERKAEVSGRFERVLKGEFTNSNMQAYRLVGQDGRLVERFWKVDEAPLFGADGQVQYIVQTILDVTVEVQLRRQKDVINSELEHRLRNTLTMVGSLAILMGQNAESPQAFVETFTDRLDAMSRNLLMISDNHWQGLTYRQIVEAELAQVLELDSPRLTLRGPDVQFSVRSTKWTALLAHELVKNALRYGCFSVPDGKLTLLWTVENGNFITEWIEEGGQSGANFSSSGFGTQMLQLMPNTKMVREMRPKGFYLRTESPATFLQDEPDQSRLDMAR
ncbi:putative sensory box sensor histidine kinase [Hyphomonas neptunium ATCC 15444]|uniref:histidine kinase n=2 Tax=Hyphomonas TaxID=85 RepID=Q0BXN1_HYPNA|nr:MULTISPECIES: HWE histidine kinase domain-containing protein [Hyphomonas]ABI78580.1 putative sensory box sensor histidine kinase [Hyphomonas neptunium ATCC 15444]KCZ93546.1 putative sensory box sensor histidine kinase [Hyphomonas hirschiana VP5]